jgi:hypothetical protein
LESTCELTVLLLNAVNAGRYQYTFTLLVHMPVKFDIAQRYSIPGLEPQSRVGYFIKKHFHTGYLFDNILHTETVKMVDSVDVKFEATLSKLINAFPDAKMKEQVTEIFHSNSS